MRPPEVVALNVIFLSTLGQGNNVCTAGLHCKPVVQTVVSFRLYIESIRTFGDEQKPPLLKGVARPKGATGDLHGRRLPLCWAVFDIILRLVSVRKKRTLRKNRRENPQSAALTASCRGGTTFAACATFPPTEESPLRKEPLQELFSCPHVLIGAKRLTQQPRTRNARPYAVKGNVDFFSRNGDVICCSVL